MNRKQVAWILAGFLAVLTACAVQPQADWKYLTEKRYPSRPPDHPIEVFPDEPSRSYEVIGEVTGIEAAYSRSPEGTSPSLALMKDHARRMGGDAIIRFSMGTDTKGFSEQATSGGTNLTRARGIVVRWN